jgi:hypothetical protein
MACTRKCIFDGRSLECAIGKMDRSKLRGSIDVEARAATGRK